MLALIQRMYNIFDRLLCLPLGDAQGGHWVGEATHLFPGLLFF